MHYDVALSVENQPLFYLVAIRIGLSKFSGRFFKNINFQPPPHLPPVFIYFVFVLEDLVDCGFCSQNYILGEILWRRGDNSKLKLFEIFQN